jgi:tetratricopeptide (TPR) repeat protein
MMPGGAVRPALTEGDAVAIRWWRLGLTLAGLTGWLWVAPAIGEEPTTFPKAAKDRYDQAQELMKQNRYKEAVQAYEDAIKLGMQDFPRAHLNKARSLLELADYDDAIKYYTDFLAQFGLEDSCRF